MAKIFPFRGVHYNVSTIGDLSDVVTQPYDQIDKELREKYYEQSTFNFVRIVMGRPEPITETENVYTRAGDYLSEWMRDGVLIRNDKPALYVYHQEYMIEGESEPRVRKGFIPLVELQEYGEKIQAHERTLEAPKLDRFNLMLTTEANTGMIFMLYSEPEREINKALDEQIKGREPDLLATDEMGNLHKVWAVTDEATIKRVQTLMEPLGLFIADGHHRYETAVNYKKHMLKEERTFPQNASENFHNCMLTLVNVDEPGLTVLPTHRLVHDVPPELMENLVSKAMEYFSIEHFPLSVGDDVAVQSVLDAMKARKHDEHLFAMYIRGDDEIKLLSLKDESVMNEMVSDFSDDWKKLDIAILHTILLDKLLGINAQKLADKTNVDYLRSAYDTLKKVKEDKKYQCMFLVNETGVKEVEKVALHGEKMPQKSTDFFPKLLSGMVMNKMILD
ncbi:DUF1015 domain-containing protein [bacterium]|nr:DUF1015 domain-containing protein [bacterium]